MKITRLTLFALGLILLGLNITGLFKSLRNEDLYAELTPYKNDISIRFEEAKKQWDRKKNEHEKEYALRASRLINNSMAHYWKDEGISKYNMRVPLWENYLLTLKQLITGKKKYEFRNYKKAIERGVGICSQPCIALQYLLRANGIEADLWDIWGHIVVDVKFSDGSRYTLDPDYGQYVPLGMEAIEADPELVREWYADQDDVYADHIKDHKHPGDIVEMYEKDGNHIYFKSKGFEDFSYIAIWIVPFLLLLPYLTKILIIKNMKKPDLFIVLSAVAFLFSACGTDKAPNYADVPKIDAHVHIQTDNPAIMEAASSQNFRFISLCRRSSSQKFIDEQLFFAKKMRANYPNKLAYTSTFSMEGFEQPGWQEKVIAQLKKDFEDGAIGVKVWKDIGMTFKDSLGNFIMIDDPRFDPVLDFIAVNNKTLVAHIGEPRNCWLPLDSMTVNNDREYFREHPQYHMFLHPECPSYESLVAARDNMLARHPGLRVVGAHLGSLEWSVDELAWRFDQYPNFAVDLSARICHFQVQDQQKVKDFILKYQDRLLYATDIVVTVESNLEKIIERLKKEWRDDWGYFATTEAMDSPNVNGSFKGLGLEEQVLRKIYAENALKWFPDIKQFSSK